MAPLVLHNVPDDELYIGQDGVTRPFAVVGAADERRSARLRRQATATHGSFGRARSRPRVGSVGPGGGGGGGDGEAGSGSGGGGGRRQKQQPTKTVTTAMAADDVFNSWKKTQQEVLSQQRQQHSKQHPQQQQQQQQQLTDDEHMDDQSSDFLDPYVGRGGGGGGGGGRQRQRKASGSSSLDDPDAATQQQKQTQAQAPPPEKQPTEVILRGYRSVDYQYAAVHHYEQIAGRICEDYPRDPPIGSRRYRASLRDAAARSAATRASNGTAALTPAERQAVMRAAGGQHWVKVTFESAQAADAALYASPQSVLGHLVSAELYRGVPLPDADDVAVPDPDALAAAAHEQQPSRGPFGGRGRGLRSPASATSSHTVDSGTVTHDDDPFASSSSSRFGRTAAAATATTGSTTSSSATVSGNPFAGSGSSGGFGPRSPWSSGGGGGAESEDVSMMDTSAVGAAPSSPAPAAAAAAAAADSGEAAFCRRIPTARRATLKAPELALLPRESAMRRFAKRLPLLNRLTGTIIGNQVPRRENGLFDWEKASLYWKLIWWLDFLFSLFSGEILDANKDE